MRGWPLPTLAWGWGSAGGTMVDAIGYRWTFVVVAALNLLALPLLPVIFRKKAE